MTEQEPIVCLADVPAHEWAKYEQQAEELGEPPDTEVDSKELK